MASFRQALPPALAALVLALVLATAAPAMAAAQPVQTAGQSSGKTERTAGKRHHRHAKHKRHPRRLVKPAPPATSSRQVSDAVPVTAPSQSSDLLFKGARLGDFWLNQSAPGAVTEVADPSGGSEPALKMTVGDGDVYPITPTENPRAELLSTPTFNAGDEFWASMRFYLPGDFPSSVPGWLTLLEGPYGPPFAGTPPWHIEVSGSTIRWSRDEAYGWDVPWQMPLVRESWVNVTIHERFASDGWIEMWINGEQVAFFAGGTYNPGHVASTTRLAMQTMDASTDGGGPNTIHLMNYRKAGMFPGNVSVLQGPLAIGRSRTAVEG